MVKMVKGMNANNNRLEHRSMAEKVTDQLLDWLMDGVLVMGQKLNTEELAQQLGVSRMPVREAVKNLEKMGLAESVPYVGSRVIHLNLSDISQIYMLRREVEPLAAFHACKNATAEEIERTRKIHFDFVNSLNSGNPPTAKEIFVSNRSFHFSIYEASHLEKVCDVITMLWNNLAFGKLIYGQTYVASKDSTIKMLKEHEEYLELFISRDAETFKKLLKENLTRVMTRMPSILAQYLEEDGGMV